MGGASNDLTINATDTMYILDTFMMTDGQARTGYIRFEGTYMSSTRSTNSCDAKLIISGANDCTLKFTGTTSFWDGNVTIRKSSGDNYVTLGTPVILNSASQTLTMTNGKISSSSSNYLRMGTSNTISGGGLNSFVDGPIQKQINTNGTTTFTFPIGKNAYYGPVTLSTTHTNTTTYTYTAEEFNGNSNSLGQTKPAGIVNTSNNRYWTIARSSNTGGLSSASVTMSYTAADGIVTPANLRLLKSQTGGTWLNIGGTGSGAPTGTITSSGITTFSSTFYTFGSTGLNPLPVELTAFNANLIGKNVELTWSTSSETDNDYFSVQKSNDGVNFIEIAKVRGAGSSNDNVNYNFTDASPMIGTSFYRLKQVDYNGKFEYSPTVRVYSPVMTDESKITSYPNPAKDVLNLNILTYQNDNNATINIYNISGQVVMTNTASLQKGGNKVTLDLNNLSHGFYMIRVTGDNAYPDQVVKFIKE